MKKDILFKNRKDPVPPFEFNETVAHVFDDMLTRSVPLYRECLHRQAQLAAQFYQKGTRLYDLGCSHGNFGIRFLKIMGETPIDMVGVDSSQAMLDRYGSRLEKYGTDTGVSLVCDRVENVAMAKASVVVLNLTLQFIAPEHRDSIVQAVHHALEPGGLLLLTEKVVHDTPQIDALQQKCYRRFKRENGYSDLEISQKREALEDVLVPDTVAAHLDRLSRVGFEKTDIWLKWFNFAAVLAIK